MAENSVIVPDSHTGDGSKGIEDSSGAWGGQPADQELYRVLSADVRFPDLTENLGKQKIT